MSKAYQAAGNWNDQSLSAEDKRRVEDLSKAYAAAQAAGNKAEMDNLHQQAENIRSGYGYSGGADGSQKIAVSTGGTDSVSAQTGGNTGGFTTLPGTSGEVKPENLPLAAGNSTQAVQYADNGQGAAGSGGQPATAQSAASQSSYTALGSWNDRQMSAADREKIVYWGQQYEQAKARGDTKAMEMYHQMAEDLRAAYGYSGGEDGSDNIAISTTDGTGTKQPYPIRESQLQDDRINNQYDKAIDAATAAIEGAYQQNMIDVDAAAAKIPGTYQAARNQVAGNAAVERANFNEYAAAAGLNSGAGGQAQLSMGNQLQGNLASISQEEANAQKDLETQRLRLKTQYQNDVAQAIANGEYQRAAALAQEGVRVDEAMVAMSQARADEAYRTWALNYQTRQNDQNAARSQVMEILQMGGTPSQTLLDAAGFDPSYIATMQNYYALRAGSGYT